MSRTQELQGLLRLYRDETGTREVDMHKFARWMVAKGWPLPEPVDPISRLAKEAARAARQEMRTDKTTGRPYRANHAVTVNQGATQLTLWVDIDEAPRHVMHKSLMKRRDQMIGDGLQLTFDADHWNAINPHEPPIVVPMDFTEDIEERKTLPPDQDERVAM